MDSVMDRLSIVQRPHDPEPVRLARSQAWESARRNGLPTRKVEDWKYTSLRVLDREPYEPVVAKDELPAREGLGSGRDGFTIVFDRGTCISLPANPTLPEGVTICTLAEASRCCVEALLCRAFDGAYVRPDEALAALNTACAGDGVLIDVPDGVCLESPIRILYQGHNPQQRSAIHLRNLIRLGAGARLTLVETFTAAQGQGQFSNVVSRAALGADAVLRHVRIANPGVDDVLINRLELQQGQGSTFRQFALDHGRGLARHDTAVDLGASHASCVLKGLYLQGGSSHVDNHIRIAHRVGPARSRVSYRGVLADRAHAVFNAKAVVDPGADGTDARQSNKNILLSRHAAVDTKPELEIYAENVLCSHGATVGQMDDAALFYLRSRGIARDQARAMLLEAFCKRLLEDLEPSSLLRTLHQQVGTILSSINPAEAS